MAAAPITMPTADGKVQTNWTMSYGASGSIKPVFFLGFNVSVRNYRITENGSAYC